MSEDAELRDALRLAEEDAAPNADAPEPDAIWAALHGELDPVQARDVVDAALRSPTGQEEIRLATAMDEELAGDEESRVNVVELGAEPRRTHI